MELAWLEGKRKGLRRHSGRVGHWERRNGWRRWN